MRMVGMREVSFLEKCQVPSAILKSRGHHSVLSSFRVYCGCVCVVVDRVQGALQL